MKPKSERGLECEAMTTDSASPPPSSLPQAEPVATPPLPAADLRWAFESEGVAFRRGLRDGLGVPAVVLFAGMMGFGALCHSIGLSVWTTAGTTIFLFALPGQVVFAEMMATGAGAVVAGIATMLTAARFFPMTLALIPQVPRHHRGLGLYATVHVLSMTSWAISMRDFPKMAPNFRLPYFAGIGLACWGGSIPGTVIGFLLAGSVPLPITLALIFLNPLFFLLTFTEVKPLANRLAIWIGGLLGPAIHLVYPDYSLIAAGFLGGTLAYLIERRRRAA